MEKNNVNATLIAKIRELNEIEMSKARVLTAVFVKTMEEVQRKKLQLIEHNFEEQAQFYNQSLEDYQKEYNEILTKSRNQLSRIIDKYNELFINMQLELQEAECNQKIAITNVMKTSDIKKHVIGRVQAEKLEKYTKKIDACIQKKSNYDVIIKECKNELDKCVNNVESKINSLWDSQPNQIVLKEESFFSKIINKIRNFFTGEVKFKKYFLEPINVELEMMDDKLPNVTDEIEDETIHFVAKIKQSKEEVNQIFDKMI